ncbi:dihydrofolate reductase family protein [Rhizobium sp. TH2]|uniref:dihydrofolate reductase family protein n=1 Tax=Rhizobium sp. TH2 TaxID=2775403 RepID=UPI002157A1C2|nr:dihydrofolate reductase family protein [Rhizobium sp. TH2]UVC07434.1 dihydrofolate reductase family protein [Rhizobium sp. TH2]
MARLTFNMMTSLDNYINDVNGDFNWGQIDDDVHQHANDAQRQISLDIYGRRMYEMMVYWETYDGGVPVEADFADAWKSVDKLIVSKSLKSVASARTTLVADLSIDGMRRLKAERDGAIAISGPTLAARYLDAGLVDEVSIYYIPVVVSGGTPMFQVRNKLKLERIEERSFSNGVNFLRYRVLN